MLQLDLGIAGRWSPDMQLMTALEEAQVSVLLSTAKQCETDSTVLTLQGSSPQLATSSCTRCATCIPAAAPLTGSPSTMYPCKRFAGCYDEHSSRGFGRPQGKTLGLLGPPLLQDTYDEFVAKATARAQSTRDDIPLDPSTTDTAPAQQEAPSPAHMIMTPYKTLDEVRPKLLAAATQMHR
jgi:hypothetical protein